MGISKKPGAFLSSRRWPLGFAAAVHLPLIAYAASPVVPQTFQPYIGYSATFEDNVLGLPNDVVAEKITGRRDRGDRLQTVQAGILLDKAVSQQRLTGRVSTSDTKYDAYKTLNHRGREVSLGWNWRLGLRLDGDLSTSYIRGLTPFTDFHQLEPNLRTQRQNVLATRWRVHPSWQLRGAVGSSETAYSLVSQQANDRYFKYLDVGSDYLARSGSTIGLMGRHGEGEYRSQGKLNSNEPLNNYKQNEFKALINWLATDNTRVEFLGGAVSRTHNGLTYRDYSGFNARTSVDWKASSSHSVLAALWREIGATDDVTTLYSVNKGASLIGKLRLSEKLAAELQFRHENRDIRRSVEFAQAAQYSDSVRSVTSTLSYRPAAKLLLRGMLYYQVKISPTSNNSFNRRGLNGSVEYSF